MNSLGKFGEKFGDFICRRRRTRPTSTAATGANAPLQKLALPLMELDFVRRDAWALQRHFRKKRDFLLGKLSALGITVKWVPTATFYVWADLSALPHPIDDCLVFLEEAVRHKVSKRPFERR